MTPAQLRLLPEERTSRLPFSLASCPTTEGALRVAGLFAGIGGVEVGLARSGHTAALLCEIERGARAVLAERFSGVDLHDDVQTLTELPQGIDLVTGGFPCQDLSQAGKTTGIRGARSGLVGEVFRLLQVRRVPWVLLENVPFMLNLARGEALEVIVSMLEHLGYRWAYRVVDTRSFGLPQRRRRVLLLAALDADPRDVLLVDDAGTPQERPLRTWRERACGFYWTEGIKGLGWADDAVPTLKAGSTIGIPSPPAIVMPSGAVITPHVNDAERLQGFCPGWTEPSDSVMRPGHRWKLVGNAVTVDVAGWLGARLRSPAGYQSAGDHVLARSGRWPTSAYNISGVRMQASLSEWPAAMPRASLADFLRFSPSPLSARATAGFLTRASRGSLDFPPGFLDVIRAHLVQAQTLGAAA